MPPAQAGHRVGTLGGRAGQRRLKRSATANSRVGPARRSGICASVIAMQIALAHFSKAVMRLHFYLDRDFAPYWKWLPYEFRGRGYSPAIGERLVAIPRLSPEEQSSAIQWICDQLKASLLTDGAVPRDVANPHGMPWFFRFGQEILATITDPEIRKLTW